MKEEHRMSARSLTRGAALLAVGVIVAACSGTASSPAASSATSAAPSAAASTVPSAPASADAGGSPAAVTLPAPEKPDLKIGLSGEYSTGNLHAVIADCYGLGKRFGLNLTFTPFSGGSQVVQALVAGQVDVSDNSGGPVVASQGTDAPLEMTFITQHNLTDIMYTAKDVKAAADLKGKAVAISSYGSQSHAGALLALKSLGLTDKDVTITQVGNDSARLAALQSGAVAASMNDAVQEPDLVAAGFNPLVHLADIEGLGGVPRTSMTVTKDFATKNPNTTLALTALYVEAQNMWKEHPKEVADCLARLAQMDPAEASKEVDLVLKQKWAPLDGRCDPTVMEFTKSVLLVANPDLASVDASKACNNTFLDQLDSLGWKPDTSIPTTP
jgi:ABC-type nitrate/sulfonate/bicarbonate transport system substrate-binding protein